MTLRFDGRAAIVTGAASGIGRAIAELLVERGARVLINDADGGHAAETAEALGPKAVANGAPVGTPEAARNIVAVAVAAFGRLDILVNNAGVVAPGPFDGGDDAAIERVMRINLAGPYALCRAAWPHLIETGAGRIVNLCSSAALGSGVSGPYAVSKAGLIGLTKEAATAGLQSGLRVNAVMPSAYTSMLERHPDPTFRDWMKANLRPEMVAPVVAYLASSECDLTGEILSAGGGRFSRIGLMESQGLVLHDLTPEGVRDGLSDAGKIEDGVRLDSQRDHQAAYAKVFAGYPLD